MRRVIVPALLVAAIAAGSVPASATAGGFVVTINSSGYQPGDRGALVSTLQVPAGSELLYVNLDPLPAGSHTITSVAKKPNSTLRLFDTGTVEFGEQVSVPTIPTLAPGTYDFFCSAHPGMLGRLTII